MKISHTRKKGKAVLYFCEYKESELETDKLIELLEKNGSELPEGGVIHTLIVESEDNMWRDTRLAGVMIDTSAELKGIMLGSHEKLGSYLKKRK